ncbi:uro-adherence factor A-like isoform X1 [Euwallacea fornicatus]|uniref:uro-adherence factor A-like isoform X1 n=1 Tax=Euwallacea fornicatus TaxID=995702 RepID=UPI00338DC432
MGKRARKTRWRALDIADDHSDSEESNTNSSAVSSRYSRSNGYYSKYSSSQSTPARRRYNQYDGSTKSTRSSSTTSENKITFNEDEYTRITTPRQDVLFKKGYLNKPKTFHSQTSTGNSTISTENSTENGTPDHQSTDLDYESQFVFPNGFVDQNGIYYVNSYEPYPLMLFNPPTYYQEFMSNKAKRYSTGSLSESMSPNNEEATSQDLSQSGGEASNGTVSDYSGPPVFNMVYTGYYVNDVCTPPDLATGHHCPAEPVKKLKKRKERKSSKTIPGDSSEFTDENSDIECGDSVGNVAEIHSRNNVEVCRVEPPNSAPNQPNDVEIAERVSAETLKTANSCTTNPPEAPSGDDLKTDSVTQAQSNSDPKKHSVLKADAEEFVPRAYHPMAPQQNLKMLPPNFMPIPLVPIGEFGGQLAPHPAFIPPGFPINFIPQPLGQKMFPAAPGFVNYPPPVVSEPKIEETVDQKEVVRQEFEREGTVTPSHTPIVEESKVQVHSKVIDIATVVSKLEAVKQLERQTEVVKPAINESKPFRNAPRYTKQQNFKRNYYNRYRNSPIRSGNASPKPISEGSNLPSAQSSPQHFRYSPARTIVQHYQQQNTANFSAAVKPVHTNGYAISENPERFQKKIWKSQQESPKKVSNYQTYQKSPFSEATRASFNKSNGYSHSHRKNIALQNVESADSPLKVSEELKITKPKSNSQWISVSSRKKKKNKSVEEVDGIEVSESPEENGDLFESYDINQLIDVVVPVIPSENDSNKDEEKRIEKILTNIAEATEEVKIDSVDDIIIPEVSDIEKSIIDKIEESSKVSDEKREVEVQPELKPPKRSKRGTQKPLLKKIMITDIFNEPETPPADLKPTVVKKTTPEVIEPELPAHSPSKETTPEADQEKKTKKKKKNKPPKLPASSNNNTSKAESSYVSLEKSLTEETLEKTNDEISMELDKLIQKGMFSSLEEKIKSINVEPETDAFFKTLGASVMAPKPATLLKAPDFNRIFQSTRQFLKPNMVSVEHDNTDIKVDMDDKDSKSCSSAADDAVPATGLVLDNSSDGAREAAIRPQTPAEHEQSDTKLYPITEAVKEWMTKTREATPEVEILKSPLEIQKEFCDQLVSDSEDVEEEEITLFSSDNTKDENDLLEFWENDLSDVSKNCDLSKDINNYETNKVCADGKSCDKCRTDSIKEGDEEIEVYESKYGQNEAFFYLQKEVEVKPASHTGELPHRAACCSLQ